ncbi:MAG: protein kinase domain-containing protein [Planctomycetota bacterium]|jgi:non-specific serine/threonine protein kinase
MTGSVENNREQIIQEAVRRFIDARWQGQEPDIDEFVGQYPGLERQIKQGIQDAQRIDVLFDSLVQADESDFAETVTEHDLVGRKVGGFEIEKIIGRGGMGVVYLAHDTKLDRSVAVKSMPAELQSSSIAQTRFKREAKLLASLNHPNIAVIHEIVEEKKSSYLILEYIPGQTLAERIAHKPLKLEEALSIGQQIAEAISAAHEKNVVHRDLKPGNIKITPEDKVKVLDFGLAKASVSEAKSGETAVTQPGRIMGTPAYMSPEQACGKPTDKRSDIWSFGCLMYEMLAGHLPFEGETATEILARIIEREPDWEVLPQEIPMNIRTLLRRCLEKKPQRRLQHIGDAVIEINETLNMPVTAPPVTTPSSTSLKPQVTARHKLRTTAIIVVAAFVIILTLIAVQHILKKEVQPSFKEIRLVVLPFENLGSTEDEYFADGITDAITARLAGIHGLSIISRQSAIQYKNSEKNPQQIGRELRVDYILEGTIQRERPTDPNSRVRIIPQLINASKDTHMWTEIYDDDMSEVFRLQSDIAERVAQALDITLIEPERRALATRPTENLEAFDYYLRGYDYSHRSHFESDKRIAVSMFEKAVELDPTFALAYAWLSDAHRLMYWFYYDRSNKRLAMAKEAADKALELDPELLEARMALGMYFYHGHLDYERALEQFAIARKSQPNNSDILGGFGFVQRRQGEFEQALVNLKRASELDPLNHFTVWEVGTTFMYMRKYQEAERHYNQAISLAPDLYFAYYCKVWLYLCSEGNTEKAHAILAEGMQNVESAENPSLVKLRIIIDMFDRNYKEALDWLSLESQDIDNQEYIDDREYFIPNALLYAQIYRYMNKKELAKTYYDEARSILESKTKEQPEHARFHSALGVAYAGLGRKEDAIREGKRGVELFPVSKDAMRGPYRVEDLARIHVMVGEHDEAIEQLEDLLSIPGPLSIRLLRLDPAWDPLRNHPRFKKLIEIDK